MERKKYMDNIRWMTVLLVVVYHVIYQFNSVGVVKNLDEPGIPALDLLLPFVYPWFMTLLFVLSGISANYSLKKRTSRQFLRERVDKLLVPSIAGIFLFGWMAGFVTCHYGEAAQLLSGDTPGMVKYLICCMMGIGPLWFAQELFVISVILLLIHKIDTKDRLWALGGRVSFVVLLLLVLPFWGSSFLLNMPVITVYRTGIYLFCFLLGFYIFSHDEIMGILKKYHLVLLVVAVLTGIAYTWYYKGINYTSDEVLQSFFTNFYAWAAILAILGCGQCWLEFDNRFTNYMRRCNYPVYLLHSPFMVMIAYGITNFLQLPVWMNYLLTLVGTVITVPIAYEILSRIPVIRYLVFGIWKRRAAK